MVKGVYHYLREIWKKPDKELVRDRMIEWRKGNALEVIEKPTRLDRARALGYKAKKGFVMLRVKINRGGRKRPRAGVKGRSTRKQTIRKTLKMNYKWVAQIRAARKYRNLEVLNSYWVGKDGKNYFYEVIMIDPSKPEIKSDRTMKWITKPGNKKRAERGLTSAAKKSRGLKSKRGKSPKLKVRPSLRARGRVGK
ncbi:50S ribosomal protein L15e [Candidatus Parvarchaeota archaeon]|jgi:large subunit ribosomal protein L15e|nr:MAG: 50S ribosomal protein L15e [Candidatus Parvarchaeota archaeon]HIG52002.1 50S ribosomal protein L15e [Candidatus Pacearchaeota archaeon]